MCTVRAEQPHEMEMLPCGIIFAGTFRRYWYIGDVGLFNDHRSPYLRGSGGVTLFLIELLSTFPTMRSLNSNYAS